MKKIVLLFFAITAITFVVEAQNHCPGRDETHTGWCCKVSLSVPSADDFLLFARINEFRAEQGKVPLVWDSCMYHAAKFQSDYLSELGAVGHSQEPYSKFKNWNEKPALRIVHFCPNLSEQLYVVLPSENASAADKETVVEDLLRNWINSPGHRAILLYVSEFGSPRAAVAISCGGKIPEFCYGIFVVRGKAFSDPRAEGEK